jgi:hypothetical protein
MTAGDSTRFRVGASGLRYAAQRLGLLGLFALILFASAGTWAWPRAWGFVVTCLVLEAITLLVLARRAPETLDRRGRLGPDVAWFDPIFAVLWLALSLATRRARRACFVRCLTECSLSNGHSRTQLGIPTLCAIAAGSDALGQSISRSSSDDTLVSSWECIRSCSRSLGKRSGHFGGRY